MRSARPFAHVVLPALLLGLGLGATGCRFGEGHFESTVPGRAFDPAGTVFTYIDQRDDNLIEEDNPRVVVTMTWIVFDPTGDLNDLEGSALEDYSHELKLRDALSLVFDEQGDIENEATFESEILEGEEQGNGKLTAVLHLAPERLTAESTYGDVTPLASRRTTQVKITADNLGEAAPALAGSVTVTFARSADDPGDALEGTLEGTFQAPLVDERSAEQNLALLDVTDTLGLPLGPRSAP